METEKLIELGRDLLNTTESISNFGITEKYIPSGESSEKWVTHALIYSETIDNENVKERFIKLVEKVPGDNIKTLESALGILEALK